ncbi:SsgA family sporulation/cell division regulator [Actinacidiphila acidipaludis]|uniref:SsgA family sporulation/cell division regulator n=1 Tax=Actinacidiphila acidipaludis TaxID=2873382 RepID=A0ABS7QGD7_9ACTN|nr:SsgA family sporulation/cell division regulator [Streptomyces acidipaludis]MBY8882234.1 SsgA family sporulation/cell division regulator [Streptomyces acidipaludis]
MPTADEVEPVRLSTVGLVDVSEESMALLPTDLVYQPSDPLAVTMVLRGPDGEDVRWTFAWDLLTAGLLGPAGEGDVRVSPTTEGFHGVEVALAPSFGVRVRLPDQEVAAFVRALRVRQGCDADQVAGALDAELELIMTGA